MPPCPCSLRCELVRQPLLHDSTRLVRMCDANWERLSGSLQPGNPMRACFYFGGLTVAVLGFGEFGPYLQRVYIYVFMYLYMYLCLFPKSWVFRGIQGNTPSAATGRRPPVAACKPLRSPALLSGARTLGLGAAAQVALVA